MHINDFLLNAHESIFYGTYIKKFFVCLYRLISRMARPILARLFATFFRLAVLLAVVVVKVEQFYYKKNIPR